MFSREASLSSRTPKRAFRSRYEMKQQLSATPADAADPRVRLMANEIIVEANSDSPTVSTGPRQAEAEIGRRTA